MRFPGAPQTPAYVSFVLGAVLFFCSMGVAQETPAATPVNPAAPDSASMKALSTENPPVGKERPGGAKKNFHEFKHQLLSPWTLILPAATAGIATATSDDHAFEPGATGYGQRYGAFLADNVNAKLLRAFVMPTLFNQVERYDRVGSGNGFGPRFSHAFAHTFVTRTRNGTRTFNMSGIPASFAVGAIGEAYYPGKYSNNWHMVQRAAWMQAGYFGQDLWREFRPEICRAIHIPCGKRYFKP